MRSIFAGGGCERVDKIGAWSWVSRPCRALPIPPFRVNPSELRPVNPAASVASDLRTSSGSTPRRRARVTARRPNGRSAPRAASSRRWSDDASGFCVCFGQLRGHWSVSDLDHRGIQPDRARRLVGRAWLGNASHALLWSVCPRVVGSIVTPEQAAKLREPFPAEMVGKLPRLTCKACLESRSRVCDEHSKSKCSNCHNFISTAHIDLDYVGHAATTDRLLAVDPEWTWTALGTDERGNPAIVSGLGEPDEPICLWINLTVCGVTRPGFGSGKTAKIAIGDAIRNAAMRFGVALDLWAKEDLHASAGEPSTSQPSRETDPGTEGDPSSPAENPAEKARKAQAARSQKKATVTQIAKIDALIGKAAGARDKTEDEARTAIENDYGPIADLTMDKAVELAGKLERWAAAVVA